MPLLCPYRLNWASRTSWGWWDEWDDTALQHRIRNSNPDSLRPSTLPLSRGGYPQYWFLRVDEKETFLFLSNRRDRWKAALLTTTLGPPPYSCVVNPEFQTLFRSKQLHLEDMEVKRCASTRMSTMASSTAKYTFKPLRSREIPVPLSSRACCWRYFVDFCSTGRCVRTDQRMTTGNVCPLSVMIMNLAVVSTVRLQSVLQNY